MTTKVRTIMFFQKKKKNNRSPQFFGLTFNGRRLRPTSLMLFRSPSSSNEQKIKIKNLMIAFEMSPIDIAGALNWKIQGNMRTVLYIHISIGLCMLQVTYKRIIFPAWNVNRIGRTNSIRSPSCSAPVKWNNLKTDTVLL